MKRAGITIAIAMGLCAGGVARAQAPVDPKALPSLAAGETGGTLEVHAANAHAGLLRRALVRLVKRNIVEASTPTARLTGRLAPAGDLDAVKALDAGVFGPARALARKGSGATVDLDFVEASAGDLYRLAADVARTNIVLAAPVTTQLDVVVKRLPVSQLIDVMNDRLGLVGSRHGNLLWLRAAGGPALDKKLLAHKGPRKLSLDARGARAGELYALFAALGAGGGGAPCAAGPPLTFRLKDVSLGTALAVTAALSGQRPAAGAACEDDGRARDLRDVALHAIAMVGTRRAAAFDTGAGLAIVERGGLVADAMVKEVGGEYVTFELPSAGGVAPEQRSIAIDPAAISIGEPASDPPPAATAADLDDPDGAMTRIRGLLAGARLAATVVRADKDVHLAILELPDGHWYALDRKAFPTLPIDVLDVEPGTVLYRFPTTTGGLQSGTVALRAAR